MTHAHRVYVPLANGVAWLKGELNASLSASERVAARKQGRVLIERYADHWN